MKRELKNFQILDFDSKLFSYKVAQITISNFNSDELKKLLSILLKDHVKLVYWSVDPNNKLVNLAAKRNGGFLADKKITYVKNLINFVYEDINKKHLRSLLHKPLSKRLLSLTLQSGSYSRFARDKNFKHDEFRKLYTKWIERSLNGEIAIDVIVYVDKNIEEGLITLESKSGYGSIGLVAVDKKYRGQGIGKQLVNAALAEFKRLGIKKVEVTTQTDNIVACKFYEKLEFVEESVQNVYHFWLNGQKKT